MAGINDYGGAADDLSAPQLGGPSGWASAVAAVLNGSDITVDDRIADRGHRITRPNVDDRLTEQYNPAANSGVGGWSVVDYDSGWRDIAANLLYGWACTSLRIRRVNSTIDVELIGLDGAGATSNIAFDFTGAMAAFRPANAGSARVLGVISPPVNAMTDAQFALFQSVQVQINRTTAAGANAASANLTWPTDRAIPTSLPGVLVTPAPE